MCWEALAPPSSSPPSPRPLTAPRTRPLTRLLLPPHTPSTTPQIYPSSGSRQPRGASRDVDHGNLARRGGTAGGKSAWVPTISCCGGGGVSAVCGGGRAGGVGRPFSAAGTRAGAGSGWIGQRGAFRRPAAGSIYRAARLVPGARCTGKGRTAVVRRRQRGQGGVRA